MNEIEEFYHERKLPMAKLFKIGAKRFGLKPQLILRAAQDVRELILGGKYIPDVRVAWVVWDRAKMLDEMQPSITPIETENLWLKKRLKRLLVACWVLVGLFWLGLGIGWFYAK